MAYLPPAGDFAHPASYLSFLAAILATGLGAPVPEDAVVLAGGYLVYRGLTALGPTLAIAVGGVVFGDIAIYFIGRGFGGAMLHSHLVERVVSPATRARAERLLGRYGVAAVFVSRFLMGVRAGVYVTAGALRMPFGRFFVANLSAAVLSVPLFLWLGLHFGGQIDQLLHVIVRVKAAALAAIVVGVAVAWLVRRRRAGERKQGELKPGEGPGEAPLAT